MTNFPPRDVNKEICEALGLRNVKTLDIHMDINDVIRVTVTYNQQSYLLTDEAARRLIPLVVEYKLVKK
jgi:hypothetical protein